MDVIKGIDASRYIASWIKVGGPIKKGYSQFVGWLKTLRIDGESLSDEDISKLWRIATNGKLELESMAKAYLKK